MRYFILCIVTVAALGCGGYGDFEQPSSDVDYPGFTQVTAEVQDYRQSRLISPQRFAGLARQQGVIVLDTRSRSAYDRIHVHGAIHLNFSDFTKESLAKIIPDKNTTILIYCNNNVDTDNTAMMRKRATLALNIPTFINLYAYGYKNVYELNSLITLADPFIRFSGTDLARTSEKRHAARDRHHPATLVRSAN